MVQAAERGKKGERYILGGHIMSFRSYFETIALLADVKLHLFTIPRFLCEPFGYLAEIFFGKLGTDTGRLAAGFGYYSSKKAESEIGYQITPVRTTITNILKSFGGK